MPDIFRKKRKAVMYSLGIVLAVFTITLFTVPLFNYLLVQGYHQVKVIAQRTPINKAMLDSSLDAETRQKLHLVGEIKEFGTSLGLNRTQSYTSIYNTGDGPAVYAVSAAPPDRMVPYRWQFPIVGKVPYLGFFNRDDALKEVRKLEGKGLDAYMRPVSAYSTLGILPDPLFTCMLGEREESLANTIIHEMTHETVFIKSDMKFNESLASFVGNQGAVDFIKHRYGEGSEKLMASADLKHDSEIFSKFIANLCQKLETVYSSPISKEEKLKRRGEIFTEAKERFILTVKPRLRTRAYDRFSSTKLNNAYLLVYRQYHGEYDIFKDLYELQGRDLKKTVEFLKSIKKDPSPKARIEEEIKRLQAGK